MSAETLGLEEAAPAHVDCVFLHGYACSARDWAEVGCDLPGTHVLVDFPGHGTVAGSPSLNFDGLVHATATWLRGLQQPVVVVGHSMGGMVAVRVASAHPRSVRGLVLVDAFPSLNTVVDVFGGAEDPRDPYGYGAVIDRKTPFHIQQHVRASMAEGVHTAGAALHAELMGLDLRADLASITAPTLILIGDRYRDDLQDADSLADRLGFGALTTKRVELVRSHHFVMLEQPNTVARHIEEFLLDQEATLKGMK